MVLPRLLLQTRRPSPDIAVAAQGAPSLADTYATMSGAELPSTHRMRLLPALMKASIRPTICSGFVATPKASFGGGLLEGRPPPERGEVNHAFDLVREPELDGAVFDYLDGGDIDHGQPFRAV